MKHMIYKLLSVVFFSLLLMSCSSESSDHITTFKITTTKQSNQGTPFYVVVKPTSFSEFVLDGYDTITENYLNDSQEEGVQVVCIIPGKTKRIDFKHSPNKRAGIYFLLTHPNGEWKAIGEPRDKTKMKLSVGEDHIRSGRVY